MPGEVVEKRRGETAKRKGERSMVHLGDVRNIDGGIAEPVDVIIGGSPCQDLSVAGEQKGFSGERSILFMDQIRIVREMREADEREGRTGLDVRPRFMVWENVPGAFSSNGGEDFRTVLQEIVRVKDKKVLVPRPPKGKWGGAGLIVGDGFSVGWRVLDAKYWGVPQRRKRIALVADFAGSRAGQILFDGESLHGNHRESETEGERTPSGTPGSTGRADQLFTAQSHGEYTVRNSASTIRSRDAKGGTVDFVYCLQGNGIDRALTAGCNGRGWKENVSYTLNTVDRPAVAVAIENHGIDGRYRFTGKIETLSKHNGTGGGNAPMCMEAGKKVRRITPLECERLQGYPDGWTDIGEWVSPSTGRVRKSSDAARYQALGNSIALPPWKYILKRISAVYERDATMASLFDGIGGFP